MFSILYVDDETALLELGRLFLEHDGDFQVDTAVSGPDALERMKGKRYDAIVSDYQMPGMDGIAFLKKVRSFAIDKFRVSLRTPAPLLEVRHTTPGDTPFILFTGRGREEVVIEAINSGVDFYLQKGGEPKSQFMELAHKIRQAIRRKRAEDTIYENEERLRFALEGANDGLWDINLISGEIYLSPRGCEILGYTIEELPGIASIWSDLINPLDMPATESALEQYKQGKTDVFEVEQRIRTKSGEWKWVLSRGKIVERDAAGKPVRMTGTHTDITVKKRMDDLLRESEERFRTMIEQSPLSIQVSSPDGRTVQVNRAFENLWGATLADLKDYNMLADEQLTGLGIMPFIKSGFSGVAGVIPEVQYDVSRVIGYGEKKWVLGHIYPVRDVAGSIRNVIVVHEDITERKRAEEALKDSERKYRNIFENAILGIYRLTPEGTFLDVNPAMARIYGYDSPSEMMAAVSDISRQPYVDPGIRARFQDHIERGEVIRGMEAELFRCDGQSIWISTNAHAVSDDTGMLLYYEGTLEDITQQKKVEQDLRASYEQITAAEEELRARYDEISRMVKDLARSEEKYRSVIESIPVGMHFYQLEPDGRLVFTGANPAADIILGITHKSLVGKTIEEAFPSHVSTEIPEQYRQVARTGQIWHTEQFDYDDKQIRGVFSVWAFPIAPGQMAAAFLDITGMIKTQNALEESGREYRTILDSIQDMFYRTDAKGTLIMISPSGVSILGYASAQEVIGRPGTDFYAFPEDREKLLDAIRKSGSVSQMEVTLKRRDGTLINVSTSSHAIYDKAGVFAGVEGIFRDITLFRQSQEKLRESEEKYRTLIQHIQDGVFLTQGEVVLFCNDVFAAMLGYSTAEVSGIPVPTLIAPEDREMIMERYRSRLEGRPEPGTYEFRMLHKDGTTRVPVRMSVGIGTYRGKKANIGTVRMI